MTIRRLEDLEPWDRTHVIRDGDDAVGWLAKAARSDERAQTTSFVASTATPDRAMDVVDQGSWDLRDFLNNPIILDNHDPMRVVGRATDVAVRNGQLEIEVEWDMDSPDPSIRSVGHQHLKGIRRAGSVGFRPGKRTPRSKLPTFHPHFQEPIEVETMWGGKIEVVGSLYERCALLEFSSATIPMNPEALQRWALGASPAPTNPNGRSPGGRRRDQGHVEMDRMARRDPAAFLALVGRELREDPEPVPFVSLVARELRRTGSR